MMFKTYKIHIEHLHLHIGIDAKEVAAADAALEKRIEKVIKQVRYATRDIKRTPTK